MASALTSTNTKSGYLYLILLGMIVLGVVYLFVFKKPSVAKDWQRQAFRLNAAAFTNGIHLANARFLTNNANQVQVDWWLQGGIGLDYNSAGYPIGTDISDSQLSAPVKPENCGQVWKFVLGPLQPQMHPSKSENNYWVELTEDKTCVFHAFGLEKMQLSYQSQTGTVILIE